MFFILIALAFQIRSLYAQDISVTASASDKTVYENEPFSYTITVKGSMDFSGASLGKTEDFELLSNRTGTSENFSIVNGKVFRSKSLAYTMVAKKSGKLQIPAAVVKIDGKAYSSNSIEMTVLKGQGGASAGSGAQDSKELLSVPKDQIFIKPVVSKTKLYVGEAATVTYKLYYRVNISRYEQTQDIKPEGFWKEEFDIDKQVASETEYMNGAMYRVATIKKFQVFPTRSGVLQISPYRAICEVMKTDVMRNRWGLSMNFDQLFNSLDKTLKAEVFAPAIRFDVMPLPEPKPKDFNGAVGEYTFEASLDKSEAMTGTPVTLKFNVSGKGNIATLPDIDITLPGEFEKYEPKVTRNIDKKNDVISGTKTVEIVAIPRASGDFNLGKVNFTYFNPDTRKYVTLSSPEFKLKVEQGTYSGGGGDKRDITRFGTDIRFIKSGAESLALPETPLYRSILFYSAFLIPVAAYTFFALQKRREDKMRGDVAFARSYKATPEAKKHLKVAAQFLKSGQQKEFFAELETALTKFIGNKYNILELAMTKEEIKNLLVSKNVPQDIIDRFMYILKTSEVYRYAPIQETQENLDALYEDAEKTISEISKLT
ncbi:MAG: protein BatD [Chlorobiales bacterium]|nr:protein BatD [Chlorobiales bacterium]